MDEGKLCAVALNSLPYMHPATYHALVARFGSARAVFKTGRDQLSTVREALPAMVDVIKTCDPVKLAEAEMALAQKLEAKIFFLGDYDYPASLADIHAAPPVLYIKGEWRKEDRLSFAIVGTRRPTAYGRHMAQKIAEGLAKAGICVVSGFAMGVDVAAHKGALRAGGRTVAVLGCGLNINYPADHYSLKNKIAQNGAVMSQFGLTAAPGKTTFPIRNRVVAGLTLGTIVVEAPMSSGALITASAALDSGKEVFAVPGPVNAKNSVGANRLIQRGHARLFMEVEDLFDSLPDFARGWVKERQMGLDLVAQKAIMELTDDENVVVKILENGEVHIDEVAGLCGLPLGKVSAILLSLEIKGVVKQSAGKMFMRS
ncbi:MAG: DNA-processing protein DprA [Nitrospinota bacterium]|nr:DNA-processing protein DprA [Nitrospinota bacterium]